MADEAVSTAAPPTSAPATTTTSPPPLSDEDQVAELYRRFWMVAIDAGNPADPSSPVIPAIATGAALDGFRAGLQNFAETGRSLRLPQPSVSGVFDLVVTVSGDVATIDACVVDDAIVFDRVNGRTLNDQVASGPVEAVARRTEDGWRIERSTQPVQEFGTGGCAP
ncbi:MAG: nuclear transport factor 2 family protein [Acidimicrobiales bacterium]|jgi:hypothetical protein|nr:nuclear transport factor 2 family protein [Acidimicrobiales bacterium]